MPDEGAGADELKRVVPIPRRWDQVCGDASVSRGEGGKKARSPRRARFKAVNTVAQGMPVNSADPVVPAPCIFIARGPWVKLCHPAFPAPSTWRVACALCFVRVVVSQKLGQIMPR